MSHEDEFIKFQEESLRQTEVLKVIFSVIIIVCLIAGGLYIKKRDGDNVIIRVPVSASSGEQWQCEAENRDVLDIKLGEDGKVRNFVMNEKCAAGTGRFLEVMARVLGCELGELSALAEKSTKEVAISSVCTVFAESEVISRLASGETAADVARGAHVAISKRVAGLCNRIQYEPEIVMTGGVALNGNVVNALSIELGYPVYVVPHCQAAGAIGAALFAYELKRK